MRAPVEPPGVWVPPAGAAASWLSGVAQPWQFDLQHIPVEEEDRVQNLVLRGYRNAALAGAVTENSGELLA
jgi:hypothetical protein